jgi:hypothetical protein
LPIDLKFWEEVGTWSMHRALHARLPPVPGFCARLFLLLNIGELGHSMGTRHWRMTRSGTEVGYVSIYAHAKFQIARMTVSKVTPLANIPEISLYM